jgi:excisionase family DNA binding protein
MSETENTGPDLLYGVQAIANYLGVKRRVAYHLIETDRLPVFKIGKTVCSKRSTVSAALEQMEAAGQDAD